MYTKQVDRGRMHLFGGGLFECTISPVGRSFSAASTRMQGPDIHEKKKKANKAWKNVSLNLQVSFQENYLLCLGLLF